MPTPTFTNIIKGARRNEKLLPVIDTYLQEGLFPSFDIHVRGKERRLPDDWFHPSTHPLWPEKQLYWYLKEPTKLILEKLDPLGTQATIAGNFWHSFMEVCLMDAGIIKATEVPVEDLETGSRGAMDGILEDEAWEFKTMNSMKLNKLTRGSPDDPDVQAHWRKMSPQYYAQAQEYMRLSGYQTVRFLIMPTEYPYGKREVVIPYDKPFAIGVRDKYLRVRQAVADQRPPRDCCGTESVQGKSCPARNLCG